MCCLRCSELVRTFYFTILIHIFCFSLLMFNFAHLVSRKQRMSLPLLILVYPLKSTKVTFHFSQLKEQETSAPRNLKRSAIDNGLVIDATLCGKDTNNNEFEHLQSRGKTARRRSVLAASAFSSAASNSSAAVTASTLPVVAAEPMSPSHPVSMHRHYSVTLVL